MMTVLMGFAGMAIDVGNWYLHIQRTQRAADSAALDGAVYLPGNETKARAVAVATLKRNGVPATDADNAVISRVAGEPRELNVKVNTTVNNTFLRIIGVKNSNTFNRPATATWAPNLKIGNYGNVMGTEPYADKWASAAVQANQRQYWLSVSGPRTWVGRGDKFAAKDCHGDKNKDTYEDGKLVYEYVLASDCPSDPGISKSWISPPKKVTDKAQYDFEVTVQPGGIGNVSIEVYDPEFALTGPYCGNIASSWESQAKDLFAKTKLANHDPSKTEYCAGDNQYGDEDAFDGETSTLPTTHFAVYDPTNKLVCAQSNFAPYGKPLSNYATNSTFLKVFHKWVRICSVAAPTKATRYRVAVWTDDNGKEGVNHFSIRAGFTSGSTVDKAKSQKLIKVSSGTRMGLYSNKLGADMRFALAEVPSSMAGSQVNFSMFDIGDCNDCKEDNAATFTLESDGTAGAGSATTSCKIPALNGKDTNANDCKLEGVWNAGGYNGKRIDATWNVPTNYSCSTSCFLFVRVTFAKPGETQVDDISSWWFDDAGAPLHLKSNPKTGLTAIPKP